MKSLLFATIFCYSGLTNAQGPCFEDVNKLCPNIEKNKMSLAKCILENESKLSPACKERAKIIKEKSLKFKGNRLNNKEPALPNNPNAKNKNTQVGAKPRPENSNAIEKQISHNQTREIKVNCLESIKQYCTNIKSAHGAVLACLKSNLSKLAPKCKEIVSKVK